MIRLILFCEKEERSFRTFSRLPNYARLSRLKSTMRVVLLHDVDFSLFLVDGHNLRYHRMVESSAHADVAEKFLHVFAVVSLVVVLD